MAQKEEEPLVLSCPYAIQGCTFSTKEETELKAHLKECQYFLNEYIKEFLQKKKQELEKENKLDQAHLIDQAIQKVHLGKCSTTDEYCIQILTFAI